MRRNVSGEEGAGSSELNADFHTLGRNHFCPWNKVRHQIELCRLTFLDGRKRPAPAGQDQYNH